MTITKINDDTYLLVENERVFINSRNINIFPCSRRGQYGNGSNPKYYDPEARLNTERTNRLRTAINGFKDNFVVNNDFKSSDTLVFVLAGYYVEVKNFDPLDIADALGTDITDIYAHLSLHTGISLNVDSYTTEILYRQSSKVTDKNYLDIYYTDEKNNAVSDDFFVGVSFTKEETSEAVEGLSLTNHNLKLFSKSKTRYVLEQTSLLPRIEHDETKDSVKILGDLTIKHDDQCSFKVAEDKTILNRVMTGSLIVGETTNEEKGI